MYVFALKIGQRCADCKHGLLRVCRFCRRRGCGFGGAPCVLVLQVLVGPLQLKNAEVLYSQRRGWQTRKKTQNSGLLIQRRLKGHQPKKDVYCH